MEFVLIALIIAIAVAIYTMGPWIAVAWVAHLVINLFKNRH